MGFLELTPWISSSPELPTQSVSIYETQHVTTYSFNEKLAGKSSLLVLKLQSDELVCFVPADSFFEVNSIYCLLEDHSWSWL